MMQYDTRVKFKEVDKLIEEELFEHVVTLKAAVDDLRKDRDYWLQLALYFIGKDNE